MSPEAAPLQKLPIYVGYLLMPFSFHSFNRYLLSTSYLPRPLLITRGAAGDKAKALHHAAFIPAEADGKPGPERG